MSHEAIRGGQEEGFSPEERREAVDLLSTPSWDTREIFDVPASKVEFVPIERPYVLPPEEEGIRMRVWNQKLEGRAKVLKESNSKNKYFIEDDNSGDNPTNLPALFELKSDGTQKRTMWAGDTMSMAGIKEEDGKIKIQVFPINYSEIFATENKEYREMLEKNGLPLPDAGVGIVVLMETKDGLIPATRRGIETPTYPGRLHSVGGNPKPGLSLLENFMEEIEEEVGLKPGKDYDIRDIRVLAIVSDREFNNTPSPRPEVVACLPLNISYREVEKRREQELAKSGQKQEDVWSLVPVPTSFSGLSDTITYDGFQMCPPFEAALTHVLFDSAKRERGSREAIADLGKVMDRLKSFERSTFAPPINRLAQ